MIRTPSVLLGSALAITLVAGALGLTFLLQNIVSMAGYLFFYSAVVASAWFGGKWPGWLAVMLSTMAVVYFFMPPAYSFKVDRESVPVFVEFAASSGDRQLVQLVATTSGGSAEPSSR